MGSHNRNLAVDDASRTGSWRPSRQDGFKAVFLFSVATNGSAVTPWRQGETLGARLDVRGKFILHTLKKSKVACEGR